MQPKAHGQSLNKPISLYFGQSGIHIQNAHLPARQGHHPARHAGQGLHAAEFHIQTQMPVGGQQGKQKQQQADEVVVVEVPGKVE